MDQSYNQDKLKDWHSGQATVSQYDAYLLIGQIADLDLVGELKSEKVEAPPIKVYGDWNDNYTY